MPGFQKSVDSRLPGGSRVVRTAGVAAVFFAILALGVGGVAWGAGSATVRVSVSSGGVQADSYSGLPITSAVSADGRYVAFASPATNLVAGDTNGRPDVFLRDLTTGTTQRVSVSSAGVQGNKGSGAYFHQLGNLAISADGRYVAFASGATNLVPNDTNTAQDIFVRDLVAGTTRRVSVASTRAQANGDSFHPSISQDGRFVAFASSATNLVAGDTNRHADVFVRDRATGSTRRVSIRGGAATGVQGNGTSDMTSISGDGRYVAFLSDASNLALHDTNKTGDIFVRDRATGTLRRVSVSATGAQANRGSIAPAISADGQHVAFWSDASNLVAGDTNRVSDVFVRDLGTRTTRRVSVSASGGQANNWSNNPTISADGRYVAFDSGASNLVAGDTNQDTDSFVRDRTSATTVRVSVSSTGAQAIGNSYAAAISADGRYVVFDSDATNLVASDTNAATDVFARGPLP